LSDSPIKSVSATLAVFRDIACLRRGPEELPVSWGWLLATIVAQAALGLVIASILPPLPPTPGVEDHSLAWLTLEVMVLLLWGRAILQVVGRPERFLQTMTAVFGVHLVLKPMLVTASWAARYLEKNSGGATTAELVAIALSMWTVVVLARVLRSATDWPVFACGVLVIAQGLVFYLIAIAIFPDFAELMKQAQ
jgi:hypothetical protein